MVRILITGANGFIGKNLVEKFSEKYTLLTPSHSELDLLDSEAVKDFFKNNEIDIVINCAIVGIGFKGKGVAESSTQPEIIRKNMLIFLNLVDNLGHRKLINFGTGGEYDKRGEIKKIREDDFGKNIPVEDYCFSKYLMSKFIENSDKNIVHLRFFGVFGKYEDYKIRFISNAICRNLLGLPIIIKQNVFFEYTYINDFVKIVEYFIENNAKEKIYNAGTGNPIDLLTIARKINEISDKKSEIIIEEQGLNNEYSCDNSRLLSEIDFGFNLIDESLKELYEYYKENIDMISF